MLKYSMMLNDSSMFVVNLAAVLLNIIYTFFFNKYSRCKKQDIHQPIMWGTILMTVIFAYTFWEEEELIEYRYGLIVTVLMLGLLGSPLIEVREIVRKKDASSIPLPITFMACIVTSLWLLYGFILKNEFMIIQNFIGFFLCLMQLTLYCIYRCPDMKKQKEL
ncbi:sugar transporter SWEET1-like [Agrilus planipennis]|nr:sugar transporter SWEET1-like [Agrilus planipennis]